MSIKVLIVDDSALMRKYLRQIVESDPRFEVYTARDGADALARAKEVEPDVITLDINMPVMDGLTCLSHLVEETESAVIMLSSLTEKGALATFEALELGAVDFIAKPDGTVSHNIRAIQREILEKIVGAAQAHRRPGPSRRSSARPSTSPRRARPSRLAALKTPERSAPAPAAQPDPDQVIRLVLIGVSTGGPGTIEPILRELPATFNVPILIAQHMPAHFTGFLATRLDGLCALPVQEVKSEPVPLVGGKILIAHGGGDIVIRKRDRTRVAVSVPASSKSVWTPCVDRMVETALRHYPAEDLCGVQLTGMGDDGAEAMAELYKGGGYTIAESEESAVIYGMPRELIERGGASVVLHHKEIGAQLTAVCRRRRRASAQNGVTAS